MNFSSIPMMSVIDVIILGIVFVAFRYAFNNRRKIEFSNAVVGSVLIGLGLIILAGLHAYDLVLVHIFPVFVPLNEVTELTNDLRLNKVWIVHLFATSFIVSGIISLGSRLAATNVELEQRIIERTAELIDSTAALKHAQAISHLGSWAWNIISGEEVWSAEQYKIFGMKPQGPAGVASPISHDEFVDALHPDDKKSVLVALGAALAGNRDYALNCQIIRPSGEIRHIEIHGSVIRDGDGNPERMVGTVHDITVQKQSEQQYSHVLKNLADGAITTDTLGIISYVNPVMETIFGYPANEMIGQNVDMLLSTPNRSEHGHNLSNYLQSGEAQSFGGSRQVMGRRKDETIFPLDLNISEMTINNITTYFGTLRDMTERVRAEEFIIQAKLDAEASSKVKSEFLAAMSHELRTPLNAIIGFSELLTGSKFGKLLNEKQKEYLSHIDDAGQHLLNLINDILDVSAIEADKLELLESDVDIDSLVESSLQMVRSRAQKGGVKITNTLGGKRPLIFADERRMIQVLVNLLSNAVKFTEKDGTVTIGADTNSDGSTTIFVSDTGRGMSVDEVSRAMEPFRQIHDKNTPNEGTGLGLPLTKKLVEIQGGSLSIKSTPNIGTTVEVHFPKVGMALSA